MTTKKVRVVARQPFGRSIRASDDASNPHADRCPLPFCPEEKSGRTSG
jgi:hypothetical protein